MASTSEPSSDPLTAAEHIDLYEALGVDASADDQQIKSAYRKAALKYHPDRHANSSPEVAQAAADKFKQISVAYTVLTDPRKKHVYDAMRKQGRKDAAMAVTEQQSELPSIDLDNLRVHERFLAAVLSKAGVNIPTMVPPRVMDEAVRMKDLAPNLPLGYAMNVEMEKTHSRFFRINITQEMINKGACVRVHSSKCSRFKLLLFDTTATEIIYEQDSTEINKKTYAGLYLFDIPAFSFQDPTNVIQYADDPKRVLFRRLDTFIETQPIKVTAGVHLIAVLGNNFYNAVNIVIDLVCGKGTPDELKEIQEIDQKLVEKKTELDRFESEYYEAKKRWEEAEKKHEEETQQLNKLLNDRHMAFQSFGPRPTPLNVQQSGGYFSTWFGSK
eukprot:TRINITY_DN5719_c0_g1_i2.p1 TRINITY_DN5719_c0_g1~~TRINITY_DN5719_c0_g1_i2.p1  ORF type:complete len:386 (-),score=94.28 TRINITY_DN5719_c0_g1_i2:35-1192(-)